MEYIALGVEPPDRATVNRPMSATKTSANSAKRRAASRANSATSAQIKKSAEDCCRVLIALVSDVVEMRFARFRAAFSGLLRYQRQDEGELHAGHVTPAIENRPAPAPREAHQM